MVRYSVEAAYNWLGETKNPDSKVKGFTIIDHCIGCELTKDTWVEDYS